MLHSHSLFSWMEKFQIHFFFTNLTLFVTVSNIFAGSRHVCSQQKAWENFARSSFCNQMFVDLCPAMFLCSYTSVSERLGMCGRLTGCVCSPVIPVITRNNKRYGFSGTRSHWWKVCSAPSLRLRLDIDFHTVMIASILMNGKTQRAGDVLMCNPCFQRSWNSEKDKMSDAEMRKHYSFMKNGCILNLMPATFYYKAGTRETSCSWSESEGCWISLACQSV